MLRFFSKRNQGDCELVPGPFGPYTLHEIINAGGMANLWLATDQDKQTVAVRCLLPHLRSDSLSKKRFLNGCQVLARTHDHEYVIGYYNHGKIDGTLYLAMEYLEGANLKEVINNPPPELASYIGNILIDMGEALEHMHDCGFMHLDFKPENIVVSPNGSVRLVDFDLAQPRTDKPTKLAKNPGTPAYMAPEQLKREPVDHRADIFAYGVAAYEILTGQKPFIGDTPDEILRKQLDRQLSFINPRDLNLDIPFPVERSILKCLAVEPSKRHGLMSVVLHDLRTALYT